MATNNDDERFLVKVSEIIPTIQECYDFVSTDAGCGAVASFVGITRNNYQGKVVTKLSYEGYIPMAEKELRKLCNEATNDEHYPSVSKIAAVHILGECPVGAASVILCCSSPHRGEAIHCVEFLINELKARVPIWKLEVYEGDEESVWKENIEWHDGRKQRVMRHQKNT
jgi:molybdopterin synthase catalytic subunit